MKIKPLFNQGFIAEMYKRELNTRPALVRVVLFAAIFVAITMGFFLGVDEQFSLQNLREHRQELLLWKKNNLFLAGFIFFISYVLVVVFFLPGAIWMTLVATHPATRSSDITLPNRAIHMVINIIYFGIYK